MYALLTIYRRIYPRRSQVDIPHRHDMYHTTLNFTATAGDLIAHLLLLVLVYT
jgi:hypothetical protein